MAHTTNKAQQSPYETTLKFTRSETNGTHSYQYPKNVRYIFYQDPWIILREIKENTQKKLLTEGQAVF